jgi:hypothetical protein
VSFGLGEGGFNDGARARGVAAETFGIDAAEVGAKAIPGKASGDGGLAFAN